MEHVVFFPSHDGAPSFRRVGELADALRLVEHLRNVEGVGDVSVYELSEVPLSFRPWYRVEVPGVAEAPAGAPAQVEPAEPPAEAPQPEPAQAAPEPAQPAQPANAADTIPVPALAPDPFETPAPAAEAAPAAELAPVGEPDLVPPQPEPAQAAEEQPEQPVAEEEPVPAVVGDVLPEGDGKEHHKRRSLGFFSS